MSHQPKIAYFSGEPIGVPVLNELAAAGIIPDLIVTNPDRPSGRKLELTPPPSKVWATHNNIPVFQPASLKNREDLAQLTEIEWDLFVVVAYSQIMPEWLIELPKQKTINLHPSLLPALRGPSPIRSAILNDTPEAVGATVMLMDKDMDHGPLLTQETLTTDVWPPNGIDLDHQLATSGGQLLASTIPDYLAGNISPQTQDHDKATFTKKLSKEMGELIIYPHSLPTSKEARAALLKIKGLAGWPSTYFFHNEKRIKVIDAFLTKGGTLEITEVIPEGKSTMPFSTYLNSITE